MNFRMKEVALYHCRRKCCLKEFKKYNTFETVVELPKPKGPTKATLIKMITKVLHKDKHFVGLLDWIESEQNGHCHSTRNFPLEKGRF